MEMNLTQLINKIIAMPDGIDKDIEVNFLNNMLAYLKKTKQISLEDYEEYKELIKLVFFKSIEHINEERKIQHDDFYTVREDLLYLYQNVLDYVKDYQLNVKTMNTINPEENLNLVIGFFKWLNIGVYKLYNNLNKKDLIYDIFDNRFAGLTYQIGKDEYAIAICPLADGLRQLFTLVHEMGHIYYYHIQRDNPSLSSNLIATECIPKIFERLFISYLRENNLLEKKLLDNFEYNRHLADLLYVDSSYVVNKIMIDNDSSKWDYSHLSFNDFKKQSILNPKVFSQYKDHLKYVYNKYSYAFLLASIVQKKYAKDEKWVKSFIKEFPKLARNTSSKEIINLFTTEEYINATNNTSSKILTK